MTRRHAAALLAVKASFGASLALGLLLSPHGGARASADDSDTPTVPLSMLGTVDGVDYPICFEEDCSDQPGQVGLWQSEEGNWYLELGEGVTFLVIDDTVTA